MDKGLIRWLTLLYSFFGTLFMGGLLRRCMRLSGWAEAKKFWCATQKWCVRSRSTEIWTWVAIIKTWLSLVFFEMMSSFQMHA
jgi:hypothetical protein